MNDDLKKVLLGVGGVVAASLAIREVVRRGRRFDWAGKVVVVTGGSRGLGYSLAGELVRSGARVAICGREEQTLLEADRTLTEAGGDVFASRCDVRDRQQVDRFVAAVLDHFGRIDVLINNAGVIQVGPQEAMTAEDYHNAMAINCWGALHTMQAVLPAMKRQGWGRVVNVASIGGIRAVPHMLPYSASKFALVGLSTGMRTELAKDNVLVTTVAPGLMRTGSPPNASFKGRHEQEYTWFAVSDSLPLLSISAENAAKQILRACQNGDAFVSVAGPLAATLAIAHHFPNLTIEVFSLAERLLPKMGGIGVRSAKGHESETAVTRKLFPVLGPRQQPAHEGNGA